MLTYIICIVGVYIYGYVDHCSKVNRYKKEQKETQEWLDRYHHVKDHTVRYHIGEYNGHNNK